MLSFDDMKNVVGWVFVCSITLFCGYLCKAEESNFRNVTIKFPEDLRISSAGDFKCEELPKKGKLKDLEITKAKDLSQCRKPHYQLKDTSSPDKALASILSQFDLDDMAAKEGNSHDFEIYDLLRAYVFLASKNELQVLDKISREKSKKGKLAKDMLNIRSKETNKR